MLAGVLALAALLLTAGPAAAGDDAGVMATVNQFADAFNKGDTKTAVAACADQTSIIDEFPPYAWSGVGACSKWMNDYDADARKNGITDGSVTLSKPRHVDINADRAYVVVSADYAFNEKGKPVKESGSNLTVALQREAAGWRIVAWSWAKN